MITILDELKDRPVKRGSDATMGANPAALAKRMKGFSLGNGMMNGF